jgi:hypothetical protein
MAVTHYRKESADLTQESDVTTMHPLISWRSVLAGLLIAFFTMTGLIGLGMAFGGIGLDEETSFQSAGIFSGIWFIASSLISLFIGSYYAARVSKFQTGRVGSAQGLVIASLFLGIFLFQMISTIGSAGQAASSVIGSTASLAGRGVREAAQNPAVINNMGYLAEDALGDLQLKSDPKTVASGLVSRLIQGNVDGARTYLVNQTGISQAEAQARISQLQSQVTQVIDKTKNAAATGLKSTGWALFLMVTMGALAAIGGGALGSRANFRKPLSKEEYFIHHQRV